MSLPMASIATVKPGNLTTLERQTKKAQEMHWETSYQHQMDAAPSSWHSAETEEMRAENKFLGLEEMRAAASSWHWAETEEMRVENKFLQDQNGHWTDAAASSWHWADGGDYWEYAEGRCWQPEETYTEARCRRQRERQTQKRDAEADAEGRTRNGSHSSFTTKSKINKDVSLGNLKNEWPKSLKT